MLPDSYLRGVIALTRHDEIAEQFAFSRKDKFSCNERKLAEVIGWAEVFIPVGRLSIRRVVRANFLRVRQDLHNFVKGLAFELGHGLSWRNGKPYTTAVCHFLPGKSGHKSGRAQTR